MDQPENLYFDVRLRRRALNKGLVTEKQVDQLIDSLPDLADKAVAIESYQPALASAPVAPAAESGPSAVPAQPAAAASSQPEQGGSSATGIDSSVHATAPAPREEPSPTESPATAAGSSSVSSSAEEPTAAPAAGNGQHWSQPPQTVEVDSAWGEDSEDERTPATSRLRGGPENEPEPPGGDGTEGV